MSNNAIEQSVQEYLTALAAALKGQDVALIQDAIYDAESHFRAAFEDSDNSPNSMSEIINNYGSSEEIAQRYSEMELTVNWALHGTQQPGGDTAKSGSLFSILNDMAAYKALIYFFVSLPLSIAYIAWTLLVGLSSVAASILLIGIPVLIFFISSMQYFSLLEGRLIEALLDIRMPRRPRYAPKAVKRLPIAKVMELILCRKNWTTSLYLTLQFPLTILYFTATILPVVLAVTLFFSPIVDPLVNAIYPALEVDIDWYWLPLTVPLSASCLMLSLYLARRIGAYHGKFAKAMLISV